MIEKELMTLQQRVKVQEACLWESLILNRLGYRFDRKVYVQTGLGVFGFLMQLQSIQLSTGGWETGPHTTQANTSCILCSAPIEIIFSLSVVTETEAYENEWNMIPGFILCWTVLGTRPPFFSLSVFQTTYPLLVESA